MRLSLTRGHFCLAFFFLFHCSAFGQVINWANTTPNKQIFNLQAGVEYGLVYGLGYGYQVNQRLFPIWTTADITLPIGKQIFDDFKTRVGIQVQWFKLGDIRISSDIRGLFRRFENDQVAISNFGLDMNAQVGYYHFKWFTAAEIAFDKAIASRFSHSKEYMESYPEVKNGWIEPAFGGNFRYGLQTGYSFKNNDITLKAGKILNQDFKTKPLLPFYGILGFNHRF